MHANKLGYKICQVPTARVYPRNEVPSKIKGITSNLKLLKEIFKISISKTQSRAEHALTINLITKQYSNNLLLENNTLKLKKLQPMLQYKIAA